ncbi:MAG: hypothetical protein Kow0089_22060 [Desulfobulbaceae bacterium]
MHFFICLLVLELVIPASLNAGALITGLDFPGSASVSTTMRFKFTDPQDNGLPAYDATYIWQVFPRQQPGYYTTFFWGNDDGKGTLETFLWDNGGAGLYYGAHPYPRGGGDATVHDWEIAIAQNDFVNGQVVYNRWYTQALRVWSDQNGKHHEFYWDLPRTDAGHRVSKTLPADHGNTNPPYPALNWGDAPWAAGNEVYCGILRGIRIYSAKLSIATILKEAQHPLSTPEGKAAVWYLNLNPTPNDISDKSGKGHDPVWVGDERPSLYKKQVTEAASSTIVIPYNLLLLKK